MGSASLERNVLNAKSRVLVFTPFSDTSFYCGNPLRLEKCFQDGVHFYERNQTILFIDLGLYVIDLLENCIIIWHYNFLRSEGKCSDR